MGAYYGLGLGLGGAPVPIRGPHLDGPGLLDLYSGAAAAYSLRALRNNTGNVVRVRRSSDDTEQDFTAAQVSDGSLVDFVNNGTSDLYGERMYFDGVDDNISISEINFGTGDFTLTFKGFIGVGENIIAPFSNANENRFIIRIDWSNNTLQSRDESGSFTTVGNTLSQPADNTEFEVEVVKSSGVITVSLNGVANGNTLNVGGSAQYKIGKIGQTLSSLRHKGSLYDIDINSQASYQGYGNTNADWVDQIGSNDGTVNGSPALYSGQGFDGFVTEETDQSGATLRTAAQTTTTEQPQIVSDGALVTDGNGNVSTIWDGVDDDLDVSAGFSGLTAANVYAVTDNAGTVTLDTLTSQDISADTNLSTVLSGLTYDKVTAVIIYPDNTNQAAIESAIESQYGI